MPRLEKILVLIVVSLLVLAIALALVFMLETYDTYRSVSETKYRMDIRAPATLTVDGTILYLSGNGTIYYVEVAGKNASQLVTLTDTNIGEPVVMHIGVYSVRISYLEHNNTYIVEMKLGGDKSYVVRDITVTTMLFVLGMGVLAVGASRSTFLG